MTLRSTWQFLQRDVRLGKRSSGRGPSRSGRQSGFAYVIAMIAVMTILVMSQVALKNMVTQGRREAEREEIWRGNQYVRAIRLYYHKTGHYPQTIDDLKKGLPQLQFLRSAAYKDPMNTEGDGDWGFIYVNAAGQLIGSVRYTSLQEMALLDLNNGQPPTQAQMAQLAALGMSAGALGISSAGASGNGSANSPGTTSGIDLNIGGQPTSQPSPNGANPSQQPSTTNSGDTSQQQGQPSQSSQSDESGPSAQPTTQPGAPATGSSDSLSNLGQPQPTGPVDGPVLGAFLTGVVSKSGRSSVIVYKGGKKYSEWEFIWNPVEEQAQAVQSGLGSQTQTSPLGLPVANPNAGGGAIVNPGSPDNGSNGAQPPAQTPAQTPTSPDNN